MYKKNNSKNQESEESQIIRVKLPKRKEVIGIIEQRLGGNRMIVSCTDKVSRNCRIPGRLQRRLWIRPGDIVIIEPWEFDNNKGDVVFKYTPTQIQWLRNKGYLKAEETEF